MALTSPRFATNARLQKASRNQPAMGRGEVGEAVRIIQQALIELGYWLDVSVKRFATPDGIFGPETEDRVRQFQRGHGLYPDGIVGQLTLDKLDKLLPTAGPALPPLPAKANFKHRVRLHLRSIALTELPLSYQEQNARMVYSQYGIYLDVLSGMSLALTAQQQAKFESVDVGECIDNKLTEELGELHKLGLQGVGTNEIVLYIAPKVTDETGKEINGCAAINTGRPAVVISATGSPWTMGHELGHVLLGNFKPVHSTDKANLMYAPSANITANPPGFSPEQLTAIRASPYVSAY